MKTGMILYVTRGEEQIPTDVADDLVAMSKSMGVSAVAVAATEDDIHQGWFHLMSKGMSRILLQRVDFNPESCRFQSLGEPIRLCG